MLWSRGMEVVEQVVQALLTSAGLLATSAQRERVVVEGQAAGETTPRPQMPTPWVCSCVQTFVETVVDPVY